MALSFFSISLGCPKNRVDTERFLGSLGPCHAVEDPEVAQLVFLNTCAFIGSAVEESVATLVQLVADLEGLSPRPLLAVGGCLVGRFGAEALAQELPEVDIWLPATDQQAWPAMAAKALAEKAGKKLHIPPKGRLLSTAPSYAWLKIGEGCRHSCAFCTIPSIRGSLSSEPVESLVQEASLLLDQGVKELVLVAQDVGAWRADNAHAEHARGDLRPLLDALFPLKGLERLRLMYLYPTELNPTLLGYLQSAYKSGAPFVPYFDMPLQHAAPNVLSRMGRPFAGNPQEVLDSIRHFFPEAALRTTFITGFPGETEQDFALLRQFLVKNRFHHVGVFPYAAEENTVAASMPDQVPEDIKLQRRDTLMALQAEISEAVLEQYLGQTLPILIDAPHEEWPGLFTGRAWFQAPEVDGITYISGDFKPGDTVEATVTSTHTYDIEAMTEI